MVFTSWAYILTKLYTFQLSTAIKISESQEQNPNPIPLTKKMVSFSTIVREFKERKIWRVCLFHTVPSDPWEGTNGYFCHQGEEGKHRRDSPSKPPKP